MLRLVTILIIVTAINAKENDTTDVKKTSESKTIYDQRQTGKYNVHVNIKDVQFFSLSDSLSNIGGDYDYGEDDYGSYDLIDSDGSDYDISHLTVNPILALLGKPTKTTTVKTTFAAAAVITSTTEKSPLTETSTIAASSTIGDKDANESSSTVKLELDTTVKQQFETDEAATTKVTTTLAIKPALKPLKVNDSIEYEEIPVEVQYYRRANHPKLPLASLQQNNNNNNDRHLTSIHHKRKRPSLQILDQYRRNNNVKIVEEDDQHVQQVKICGRGEFRDSFGRCRLIKAAHNGRNRVPGLHRVFNMLSSFFPKSK